jgi:hypothetical protein
MCPQSCRSPGTKCHLDMAHVENYKVYYKGEGDGFPQVRAMVSLVSSSCPWLVLAPKVLQLCTNHLVLVLFVQVCVNNWNLSILLSPIPELQHAWCAPKLLIRLKMSLGGSNNGIVWSSGHAPALGTRRGRRACWGSGMGLGRGTSFT